MRISSDEVPGKHLLKLSDEHDSNELVESGPTLSDSVWTCRALVPPHVLV